MQAHGASPAEEEPGGQGRQLCAVLHAPMGSSPGGHRSSSQVVVPMQGLLSTPRTARSHQRIPTLCRHRGHLWGHGRRKLRHSTLIPAQGTARAFTSGAQKAHTGGLGGLSTSTPFAREQSAGKQPRKRGRIGLFHSWSAPPALLAAAQPSSTVGFGITSHKP